MDSRVLDARHNLLEPEVVGGAVHKSSLITHAMIPQDESESLSGVGFSGPSQEATQGRSVAHVRRRQCLCRTKTTDGLGIRILTQQQSIRAGLVLVRN